MLWPGSQIYLKGWSRERYRVYIPMILADKAGICGSSDDFMTLPWQIISLKLIA
jgi:hypothetical protein